MNKKIIIILAISLVVVIAATIAIFYFLSLRTVSFAIKPDNVSITVYDQETNEEIGTFSDDGTLQLQAGDYRIIPSSEQYDETYIGFTVADDDITITIDPDYSSEYRDEIRKTEQAAINTVISSAHANVIANFTINDGTIYKKGEWYGTTLTQHQPGPGQNGDIYRVVLKKEGSTWKLQTKPEIVLGSHNYPNIPHDVLSDINSKQQ